MSDRYQVEGAEGEFQAGSEGRVLANLVDISSPDDMNELELNLLAQLYEEVLRVDFPDRRLGLMDIKRWHRLWLGNVYSWAGQERLVNMSKQGFMFAAAPQVPRLLADFERECLISWTPCHGLSQAELLQAIAVTHVEFILIHPFREGNGRLSRLLADVMAVQAGLEPLDYSPWEANKADYVAAIHAGLAGNYAPMRYWVERAMDASSANFSGPA